MDIKALVKSIISKYKTNSPYEIAQRLDIMIVKIPMDLDIRGCYQYFKRNKIIYLNSLLSEWEQRIALGHELGHAVLHTNLNMVFLERSTYFIKSKFEIEADKFAAELLIDDSEKETFLERGIVGTSIYLGVPEKLVEYKFCR